MTKKQKTPFLRQIIIRIVLLCIFLPLVILGIVRLGGIVFLEGKDKQDDQYKTVQAMANMVNYYLENGEDNLEIVANVAENSHTDYLSDFMKNTWKVYKDFDALYYIDENSKIKAAVPANLQYSYLHISQLPDLKRIDKKKNITISKPFISPNTGKPTVYLIKQLQNGGCVVGELSLGVLKEGAERIEKISTDDSIIIMDQNGTVLFHPCSELVKKQANLNNLEIFKDSLIGKNSAIYSYNGTMTSGVSAQIDDVGWIIVDQVPLYILLTKQLGLMTGIIIATFITCLALVYVVKKQFQKYFITPMELLSKGTTALTNGEYSKVNGLSSIPATFEELNNLITHFLFMSDSLEARENLLRQSEKLYHDLFNKVPIGLFRVTSTGEIVDINPTAIKILRYPNNELLLKDNIMNIFNISSFEKNQLIKHNESKKDNFEKQIKRYDGVIIWIRINLQTVNMDGGQKEFYQGSLEDITERKQTENKIKRQQELLFIAEKEKRKSLEKSLIMKDEFISLVSHEFKTPLNVIYSAIQLLENVYFDKIPDRVKEILGSIKQNTFRQMRLANNLLDITRLNSGQYKLNERNNDIVYLTQSIVQSVQLYIIEKNIKLSFETNVKSKIISIDDEKYERIILNLLSNAVKFTDAGGEISVNLVEERKMNMMKIMVCDTGIGIPKDKLELIFERFGQVDSNLSRRAEGTGIGLSLVKLLTDILGGTIEVKSDLNIGSTFMLTLPIKEPEDNNKSEELLDVDSMVESRIKVELSDIYL